MSSSSNLLASSLRAVEPIRQELISQRRYAEVEVLRSQVFSDVEKKKAEQGQALRLEHRRECRKLFRASEHALHALDDECVRLSNEEILAWTGKKEHLAQKHSIDLNYAHARVLRAESHRRMIHSSYVRDLQQAEKKLADLHCYDECARTHDKIKRLEVVEEAEMKLAQEARIRAVIDRIRNRQKEEMSTLERRMQNALSIARGRLNARKELNANRFNIHYLQMQHAHAIEAKVRSVSSQHPRWIHVSPRERFSASKRGSQLLEDQQGTVGKILVPSLCDLYGNVGSHESLKATVSKDRQLNAIRTSTLVNS